MPYYCTVPRCTSMAGKSKNISFHQFPRDEGLAHLWNQILKRGKPYTKYSKVCSLHFKPEDYTFTNVGKNKGQWRTLRKDAVPSMNLPQDCGPPIRSHSLPGVPGSPLDPQLQHQLAQAVYLQTMLAMQAAALGRAPSGADGAPESPQHLDTARPTTPCSSPDATTSRPDRPGDPDTSSNPDAPGNPDQSENPGNPDKPGYPDQTFFSCDVCKRSFKDPDVLLIHKRTHTHTHRSFEEPDTLRANPILANLLNQGDKPSSLESQLMAVMALNMAYYKTLEAKVDSSTDNEDLDSSRLVIDEAA